MIIDDLAQAKKYIGLHPLFEKAFQYIAETDFDQQPEGKTPIADGLLAIYTHGPGKSKEESVAKFECHNYNIDIQVCLQGKEEYGWKPRGNCTHPNGDFNETKDLQLFQDAPDTFFHLTDGQFVIFYPEDVHAPLICEGNIKKLVIKVKI